MKCPMCPSIHDSVIDSREPRDASRIRRRRQCKVCGHRFTTYEYPGVTNESKSEIEGIGAVETLGMSVIRRLTIDGLRELRSAIVIRDMSAPETDAPVAVLLPYAQFAEIQLRISEGLTTIDRALANIEELKDQMNVLDGAAGIKKEAVQ